MSCKGGWNIPLHEPKPCRRARTRTETKSGQDPTAQPRISVDTPCSHTVTAGHLAGVHGWRMRWRSRRLLGRYPTSCVIASDGHDDRARRPAFDRLPAAYRPWCCPSLAALATWAGASTAR